MVDPSIRTRPINLPVILSTNYSHSENNHFWPKVGISTPMLTLLFFLIKCEEYDWFYINYVWLCHSGGKFTEVLVRMAEDLRFELRHIITPTWLCCRGQKPFSCSNVSESVGLTGQCRLIFFPPLLRQVAKVSTSYHITFEWSCNVALCGIIGNHA